MEHRLKICRLAAYIGLGMVLVVYIALSYLSGNIDSIDYIPAMAVSVLQFCMGVGSALTVTGIILGIYYKGKIDKQGPGPRKK